jgi:predicted dithiol-disulfide oxidoreductase (DUF899 family)
VLVCVLLTSVRRAAFTGGTRTCGKAWPRAARDLQCDQHTSLGSDFNFDFNVSFTEEQQREGRVEYNYRKSGVSSRTNEISAIEAVPEGGTRNRRTGDLTTHGFRAQHHQKRK